ncbi:Coenzyme Q-binding protein COQ10, mitochondrial [Madurella mycetomatis]|uniref:Coenzyme Q-binding protein COQ10, mitochondrial n=1 Tax=Madurella mycetomatis TaxID=100816 RepID=A0A175WHK6_9PEZI|nr:Coenzyme Q-binding protein COQ10, mitochondrial [Madurella mycetomatis]
MPPPLLATARPASRRLPALRIPIRRLPSLAQTPGGRLLHPAPPTPAARLISTSWLLSALPNLSPTGGQQPPPPKTLRARRTLPYPAAQIYTLIADIDSYSAFLPHCTHSQVTSWTTTAAGAGAGGASSPQRHPAQADLTVGWGPFTQTYTSRVYCVPGEVVEAVSGDAEPSLDGGVLRRAGYQVDGGAAGRGPKTADGGIFKSLVTRWTVKPVAGRANAGGGGEGGESTEVTLSVTFQFANPALGFAVGQVADDKVDEMVEAFEERARRLYGRR